MSNVLGIRAALTNAIRYWERGRVLYNAVLLIVVLAVYFYGLPHSRQVLSVDVFLQIFILAMLANVAYCAAYVVDIVAQASGFQVTWLKARWILLALGIAFAATIAQFVARGIFGIAT